MVSKNLFQKIWLLDISLKYAKIYKASDLCLKLFVKYCVTDKRKDLNEYLEHVFMFEEAEREIEKILINNKM